MPCGCGSTTGADCLCAIEGTTGILVDGNGSASFPYEISPQLSGATDNDLQIAADGLYVPKPSAGEIACFQDENGNPISPDPETGCLTIPQTPCILDYSGAPIEPVGGCIQLPTSGTPPAFDGGLTTTPDGELTVDVTDTWPLVPLSGPAYLGNSLTGGKTVIDSAGQVRTAPEHAVVYANGAVTQIWSQTDYIAAGDVWCSPTYGSMAVTNPSNTRTMRVLVIVYSAIHASSPAVGGMYAAIQRDTGGGYTSIGDPNPAWPYNSTGAQIIDEKAITIVSQAALSPGATYSANHRVCINLQNSSGTGTRHSCYMKVDMIGMTL
jgi:hypothetical protein